MIARALGAGAVVLAILSLGHRPVLIPSQDRQPSEKLRSVARSGRRLSPGDELPLLLDLLASATAAGLAPMLAFRAAVDALPGPLGAELAPLASEAALGAGLPEGVRQVAGRLALPDLARAGALLERSGSLGTPLSVALRDLSAELRRARQRLAEQRARTAPVRMLFPLVFLILPAFLLLTVVPMMLATLRSLG